MGPESWIAIYAAFVATGALFLEVRRWFESGPNISIAVSPNMTVFNGGVQGEKDLTIVTVMNRGDQPTTITTLGIYEFESNWHALAGNPKQSYIVPKPQLNELDLTLPRIVAPGEQWKGFIRANSGKIADLQDGRHWVTVFTTGRDKPFIKLIPQRRKPADNEKKI